MRLVVLGFCWGGEPTPGGRGVRLPPSATVDAHVAALPHARGLLADLEGAVQMGRPKDAAAGLRVLFVSPAPAMGGLAATGGERNVAFLSAGAARVGLQVASFAFEGQTADFLAAQHVAVYRPGAAAYVQAADAPKLRLQVARFARALARWRERPRDRGARADALAAFDAVAVLLSPSAHDSGAQNVLLGHPPGDPLRVTLAGLVRARQLRAALAAHRAQVCVVDRTGDALAAVLATHDTDVRVAWYVQNADHAPEDGVIAQEASVVACSPSALAAKRGEVTLAQPSYVVRNGIALARFGRHAADGVQARRDLHLPQNAFVVGQVGYVNAVKDQATTLTAFARLYREVPEAYLVFVGGLHDVGYRDQLSAAMRDGHLKARVRLLGDVDDVATVLPALDVLVSASRAEGFGLAVAEAMAAGLAVVLTQIPPFLHLGGETALYFAPGDDVALARQLRTLVDLPTRARFAAMSRRRAHALLADHAEMLASFVAVLVEVACRERAPAATGRAVGR